MSGYLHVKYDPAKASDTWILDRDYERQTFLGPIVVPAGFVTDLASVPQHFWHLYPRWGRWSGAAVVHDYLYRIKPLSIKKYEADQIFYDLMKEDGVSYYDRKILRNAVRNFGQSSWDATEKT